MIATDEAELKLEVRVYDVVLLVITSVDIAMQLYVIVVMLVATPEKMKPYRFFMLLYTVCDLAFAVMIGVALHPVPIGMMPCAGLRGIFQFADRHSARFGFSLALFCGTAVLSVQDYCILYRGSVVLRQGRYMSRMVTRKAKLIALFTILAISSLNAFVGYFLTNLEKFNPEKNSDLHVVMSPGSDAFVCLAFGKSPIWPAGSIVLPLAGIIEVVFYGLAVSTVVLIRKAGLKMSLRSRKLNSQLSWLLLMHTTSPIVCIFVPFLVIVAPILLNYDVSGPRAMAGFIVFSSFPLINATLTIVFVKPYRDFTVHLLTRRARLRQGPE